MPKPRTIQSIYVEAEPRDVYDFALGDLQSLPDWMSSVDAVQSADASWPAVGSSHVYTRTVSGRTVAGKTTIVEADAPRRVVMREEMTVEEQSNVPSRAGRSIWTFEPEGRGTRVTMELEGADLSLPVYLLWKLLFGRRVRYNLEQTLANLKRICEEELEDATPE